MPDEPITFVVERHMGREMASVIVGPLPERLTVKGSGLLVYALRLDRLPDRDQWAGRSIAELYALYRRLREKGKLPPANLADPPRKVDGGQKGVQVGPGNWWKPKPLPRPEGWSEEMDRATRVPWRR